MKKTLHILFGSTVLYIAFGVAALPTKPAHLMDGPGGMDGAPDLPGSPDMPLCLPDSGCPDPDVPNIPDGL